VTIDLERELHKTQPDYVVYKPAGLKGEKADSGNEHFLVFNNPKGGLSAVWTQSTYEGQPDQRIVFASCFDEGNSWNSPILLAGPIEGVGMASWGFPLVSRTGRIYVLYSRHIGVNDLFTHTTGLMAGIFSDDGGKTWSAENLIPVPRSCWDHPDTNIPTNWIVWQKPQRLSRGKYFTGFTHWVSPAVRPPAPLNIWWAEASVVSFMRFENIDENPRIEDIQINYLVLDSTALQVPLVDHPDVSVVQEPSLVKLPDGRLFCTMRTTLGHPFYSFSADEGETWEPPQPLRQNDHSLPLPHPCSPCPIYQVNEGEYIFLFHNHDGHFGGWGPQDSTFHRRPIYIARGLFNPTAAQPVWFSEPVLLMDNQGTPILRSDLAMYASVTKLDNGLVLWYPDRKFFLLGKRITRSLLDQMPIPYM
jgi:hypothetical protein